MRRVRRWILSTRRRPRRLLLYPRNRPRIPRSSLLVRSLLRRLPSGKHSQRCKNHNYHSWKHQRRPRRPRNHLSNSHYQLISELPRLTRQRGIHQHPKITRFLSTTHLGTCRGLLPSGGAAKTVFQSMNRLLLPSLSLRHHILNLLHPLRPPYPLISLFLLPYLPLLLQRLSSL